MVRITILAFAFALTLACCSSTKAPSTDLASVPAPTPAADVLR